jgi:predicted 3-demethylubiquinone-9 3-methyltransferase (glyoxalase superfamily)
VEEAMKPKIRPFLWFDDNAEEAAQFYVSLFENSAITGVHRYGEAGPGPAGSVMIVEFRLDGKEVVALNGGPHFTLTEAFSFQIDCDSQEEVDDFWEKLTADGGEPGPCGWLKDKFGLSWQVTPSEVIAMLLDPDPAKANRVMQAVLQMGKIDIAQAREAYEGG